MATATENLIDSMIAGLRVTLPPLLSDQGLDAPAASDYLYGEPELKPTSKTPYLSVDAGDVRQDEASIGGGIERDQDILVYAIISGPDPQTVARHLHRWADCLITAVERLEMPGLTHLMVNSVDFSPNLRGGNILFRGCIVSARTTTHRTFRSQP